VTEGVACPRAVHGQPDSLRKGYRLGVETFGAALKRWREVRQLSVRGLAAKAHYGKSHISGLENGRLVRPEVARHLDDLLQAGGELIRLAAAQGQARHADFADRRTGGAGYYASLAAQLLNSQEDGTTCNGARSCSVRAVWPGWG
jgi:transcriptional regulator with XRE-family HTH domain